MKKVLKVLVVEDEKFWHSIWRRQIAFSSKNGNEVVLISAFTIKEAEEQFAANQDLAAIAMDACVPGRALTTPPLVRKFRETFDGPMIAISSSDDYQQVLVRAGCSHCSPKGDLVRKLFEIFGL